MQVGTGPTAAASPAGAAVVPEDNTGPANATLATPTNALAPAETVRQPGKYYLIIERLQGSTEKDKLDARAIVDYLRSKGKLAQVNFLQNGDRYIICSLTGFASKTSKEAMDYAREIQELGKAYVPPKDRGKYSFSQNNRKGEFDPSFYQERAKPEHESDGR